MRLCVPLSQVLVARNWNLAISGWPLTASRVANSVAVSTPLRLGFSMVVLMACVPSGFGAGGSGSCGDARTVVLAAATTGSRPRGGAVEDNDPVVVGDPGGEGGDRLVRGRR